MFQVEPIEDAAVSKLRAVFWLTGAVSQKEEARSTYDGIKESDAVRKKLKRAFDYWVLGFENKKLHHGWDKSEHDGEFVRMHVFKGNNCRLYGLKINPLLGDARYQACILIGAYRSKTQHEAPVETMRRFLDVESTKEFAAVIKSHFEGRTP